jgi:hypothetical protein
VDHILRAAASLTGERRFVVVGSAAVVIRSKNVPATMMLTPEIDMYAPDAADIESVSEMIDSSIGQGSAFHNEFGYYGDGVSPGTAKMPADWTERASEYHGAECPGVTAIVPEENDIALAKLAAWRDKDQTWLVEGVKYKLLSLERMAERLDRMPSRDLDRGIAPRDILTQRIRDLASRCHVELDI